MNLENAIKIAVEAHTGQVDKGGNPYILHTLRVMLSLNTEEQRIVGVLLMLWRIVQDGVGSVLRLRGFPKRSFRH